jgi:hypothetical protein
MLRALVFAIILGFIGVLAEGGYRAFGLLLLIVGFIVLMTGGEQ